MILIFSLVLFAVVDGAQKGEPCTVNNLYGICTEASKCQTAIEGGNSKTERSVCQSPSSDVIVCCGDSYILDQDKDCDPIPAHKTASKTGQKAWDKCIDYQNLVFPCENGVREEQCPINNVEELILAGNTHPRRHEFPYLVLLGYTNEKKRLDWLCAGALVSEQFVLTAAHCVSSRLNGPVTHVALHPTDRSDIEQDLIYKIKTIIRHPEYRPPRTYNDIALIELEQAVPLSSTVVPACLVGSKPEERVVTATTWNTNDILKNRITWLRKISLTLYSKADCYGLYPDSRRGGYNDTTQVCYGERTGVKDMCQDDGGTPLVVRHKSVSCMYSIVGVASYGRGCFTHSPGVYTRPEPYVDWVESIVWP